MRFHVLATDYDGTIAHDGVVPEETIDALERVKKSGRKLVLVTGRELPDLLAVFNHIDLFHLAVMENGATIYNPATKETRILAERPPAKFAEALLARGVPISTGDVIVATVEPHEKVVFETIHQLGLELQVIFNKGSVMVLPSGVNKATGLVAALTELGLSPHNAVGVGDAENDHAFLKLCECSAAVANALPAVKGTADIVTNGARGYGVAELIDELLASDLSHLKTLARHRIIIGDRDQPSKSSAPKPTVTTENETNPPEQVGIDPAGAGVLVCGTSGSGKSTLTYAILEQLSDAGYQALVVDPEGDYADADFVTHVGNATQAPMPEDVIDALKDLKRSIVVNLLGVPLADRPSYFTQLLPALLAEKARTGRPHWLVVDEAHHLLPVGQAAADVAPLLPDRGLMFVTVHAGSIEPTVLANVGTLIVIGDKPGQTINEFCTAIGKPMPKCPTVQGDKLPTGDAMLWQSNATEATLVHTKSPRTERKRHLRKYASGNLGAERSFYFRGPKAKLNLKAPNLFQFLQLADGVDDETWEFHRKNGDFSSWVRKQIKDNQLADELAIIEADSAASPKDTRAAVRAAIEARYTLPADKPSGHID